MKSRSLGSILLLSATAVVALVVSGALDIRVDWRAGEANALDLFGSSGESHPEAFWQEGSSQPPAAIEGVPTTFADLAERVSPGVVNIRTERTVQSGMPRGLEEFFFGQPFGHGGPGGPQEREVPSLGSGFVISPDGYIVTNNHVIEDTDTITVHFDNGKQLDAEIVGRDPKTDVALIRVDTDEDLFSLPLGDSHAVRPGEWVVAIGNPMGLEHTVTAGIVSAMHRNIGMGSYDDFIQTDAAINPGNSGGPLINLKGEVIGINTAINRAAQSVGFAVPVNMAKDILPQLRAEGHVTRGWLGVVIQQITPEIAEQLELDDAKGALVSQVEPDGPADEAGIERYDVIRRFNGRDIDEMSDLPRVVASTGVGKTVDVIVTRDGKSKKLRAQIAKMKEPGETQLASVPDASGGAQAYGMRVQDLTDELADRLGVDAGAGVVVTRVAPGSSAADAGLRSGDVILEVDKQPASDVLELDAQLADADDGALLLVRRNNQTVFVPLKPPTS